MANAHVTSEQERLEDVELVIGVRRPTFEESLRNELVRIGKVSRRSEGRILVQGNKRLMVMSATVRLDVGGTKILRHQAHAVHRSQHHLRG